jgi:hypothetical protein
MTARRRSDAPLARVKHACGRPRRFSTGGGDTGSDDTGSSLPFVLLCFLIAAFMVAGVTSASSAFLAQRDLQADCDGAAVAAASGVDPDALYGTGLTAGDALPLATEQAEAAVHEYRSVGFPSGDTLDMSANVDAERVTVACNRVVKIAFGSLFGVGAGLDRSTVSTARLPLRP